jgi:hypothetical protein
MVLLTSSTISVLLTSGVVCLFTFLLFLSGYILQQQSVRNIQHVIRAPNSVLMNQPLNPNSALNDAIQKLHHNVRRDALYDSLSTNDDDGKSYGEEKPSLGQDVLSDWESESPSHGGTQGNYAYLQLLSHPDPSDICSAILFFKMLATGKTAVHDRLFMYPQEWDQKTPTSKNASEALAILRAASRKYDIWLLPIDMSPATSQGYAPTDAKLLRLGQVQFMQYDGVLYLRTPGILLDAKKLDKMFLSWPLPLQYDKNRPESYNNAAWIPMPLRAEKDVSLPPAYLITVNSLGHRVEARTHVPNILLPGFRELVAGPDIENPDLPAYVFFEQDKDGHVHWKGNRWFGAWRVAQQEVCDSLDLESRS